jgi:glucokinase
MIIIADIGGTSARLVMLSISNHGFKEVFRRTYITSECDSVVSLFSEFTKQSNQAGKIRGVVCGIPGDVKENRVGMLIGSVFNIHVLFLEAINIQHWGSIDGDAVGKELGIERFILLNDFECAAYAINGFTENDLICIRRGTSSDEKVKVMVGLGTGLGVAFAVRTDTGTYAPNPSEAGWIHFLEATQLDRDLVAYLRGKLKTNVVSFEQVCCGSSLIHIHNFFKCQLGETELDIEPKEICAKYNLCDVCRNSVDLMLEYLGRFLAQMSLIFKPTGGFFLTGGAMDSLISFLPRSDSFSKGLAIQDHPILAEIGRSPDIYFIRRGDVGLLGAQSAAEAFFPRESGNRPS